MQPSTGHLIDTSNLSFDELYEVKKAGYEELPPHLTTAANKKLKGNKSAYVSLTSGGKLSRHAAKLRKKKRMAQKKSRKNNR